MRSFWTFTPKMKTNDLITAIMSTFLKKCTVLTKPVFVYEIVWRQDYKRKNNKIE